MGGGADVPLFKTKAGTLPKREHPPPSKFTKSVLKNILSMKW